MNTKTGIEDIKKGLLGVLLLLRGVTAITLSSLLGLAKWIQKHTEIGWQTNEEKQDDQ